MKSVQFCWDLAPPLSIADYGKDSYVIIAMLYTECIQAQLSLNHKLVINRKSGFTRKRKLVICNSLLNFNLIFEKEFKCG